MENRLATIGARNFFGQVCAGAIFIAIGAAKLAGVPEAVEMAMLVAAIVVLLLAIYGQFARNREVKDEMYWEHRRKAADHAFTATALILMAAAAVGAFAHMGVDMAASAFIVLGVLYLSQGTVFALLERGGSDADD